MSDNPQDDVPEEESVSYDEVAEWWDNSEYSFSTYPPSDWHAVMCLKEWSKERLRRNPKGVEDTISQFIFGHVEVRDGQVPPTKDPDYSGQKWVAWDLEPDGTGNYFDAEILD
jgi:hypothetical protein